MNHGYVLGASLLAATLGFAPGVVGARTEKIALLAQTVAETYVPVEISVAYAASRERRSRFS
jgi:hypothetical protein